MAIELISKIKPKNNGTFALVDAADVEMPNGSRLSEFNPTYPVVDGTALVKPWLEPETYYQFGEVDALDLTLVEKADGTAHEYVFDFVPGEGFAGLTISPEVRWLGDPQFPVGKRCIVSVCMGMAVMGCG